MRLNRRQALIGGAGATLALLRAREVRASFVGDDGEPLLAIHTTATLDSRALLPRHSAPDAPSFSDVATVQPWEALLFLAGRDPRYAGASVESIMAYSPADILETMDTDVLDAVLASRGANALVSLYYRIATHTLDALLAVYGGTPVVLALDAGHGGLRGVYYDPGSHGTEAHHARQVVAALEERAALPNYASITVRRIYNDAIGDDFGLPPPEDRKGAAALTLRNIRTAILAHEADLWNAAHPDEAVAVHVLSVHFNAGSGGILVLHQGAAVSAEFRRRSVAYASAFVRAAQPALNATGLLPYSLRLALGTGLSDDRLLYEPQFRVPARLNPYTSADRSAFPRRYAMLQTSLLQRDYALGALLYHRLV